MKNLNKVLSVFFTLVFFTMSMLLYAQTTLPKKADGEFPVLTFCITADGTIVGYSNDCDLGSGGCVDNDC